MVLQSALFENAGGKMIKSLKLLKKSGQLAALYKKFQDKTILAVLVIRVVNIEFAIL